MDFSPEQLIAINETENVIISAGAGSGKTAVMIENIVTKLLHPDKAKRAGLENMLIVTFTRAAASDMRVKLSARLGELKREAQASGDSERLGLINAAVDGMPICDIGTLHGFCQRLIKTYFFAAGIDPSAAVMDEDEAGMLKSSAARQIVRSLRARVDVESADVECKADGSLDRFTDDFNIVCDALCRRNSDDAAVDVIISIAEFALSTPDPVRYLIGERDFGTVCAELDGIAESKIKAFETKIENMQYEARCAGCDVLANALDDFVPYLNGASDIRATRVSGGDAAVTEINGRYKALKEKCKKLREYIIAVDEAKTHSGEEFSAALRRAALLMLRRYGERKQAVGKIDYSDLEHGAKRVLADANCRAELARKIKYVFIDEYQDVNELQAEIADTLKGFAKMFLVGDVKQSIYGFRRCHPRYFMRALAAPDYKHVVLARNYRSSARVIDFVNSVFSVGMTEDFGGVDYDNEKLICGRPDLDGDAELVFVECAEAESDAEAENGGVYSVKRAVENAENTGGAYDGEALYVASRIREYLSGGEGRRAGDAAVLVRSTKTAFCADLARLFGEQGIDCRFGRKSTLSDFPEAIELADILRAVDNRFDDVALYTALRSPMGMFSDEELLEISNDGERAARENNVFSAARGRRRYPFWQKVENYAGRLKPRLDRFFALRDEFRNEAKRGDCADVLSYITARINYFQYVYDYFASDGAAAVEAFIKFATSRRTDVHSFLDFIDNTDVALDTGGGDDAVTITTIHASKGLEYDFVIVADIAHGFNMQDIRSKVIVSENGVAIKYPDAAARTLAPSAEWLCEREKAPQFVREEEMRLFYVALTRAKRRLLVCGKSKTNRSGVDDRKYGCYADFVSHMPSVTVKPPIPADVCSDAKDCVTDERIVELVENASAPLPVPSDSPIKTCVTAIAESSDDDYTGGAPKLTADDCREDALARGTAYHRAMELIDFDAPDFDGIRDRCENIELVDERKIMTCVAAMKELTENCSFYYKERYFIVDLDGSDVSPDVYGKGESVLVQGVIDLLIVDGKGNATVVDYKTSAVNELASEGYATQLRLYAEAVERTTPFKVVRTCLYSFVLDKIIDVATAQCAKT